MTRGTTRALVCALAPLLVLVMVTMATEASAQIRYDRGQNVAPVFEGWERNPDGTFTMVFGYMNRNYEEMPHAPIGPNNAFKPGPADRGQPTRFYTRRQQFVFRVPVPADWGDKDLVWTLTANGRTDQAFGSLWPSWEIDDGVIRNNRGMGSRGAPADNQHPRITLPGGTNLTLTLPDTLTFTAVVSDDGIPGPRPRRDEAADDDDDPQAAARRAAARERRARRPHPTNQAVVNARVAGETGLAVTWVHYRGPGAVTFDPMSLAVEGGRGGEVVTTVRFSERGTHVLRGYADDSIKTTPIDVTVIVR
ncbi:MAG: hypothetical protein E2P06_07655 [Acidobacteria bacterium]|nr:hypothetical protein [Acidobacteriota bacterium]TDI24221.1 MAG: hypothetical protein E2P06_07655 [Acidobacteriota bacterium]